MTVNLEQVTRLADQLPFHDRLWLAQHLAQTIRPTPPEAKPRSLRGSWQEAFPPDFDVDKALREIRSEWQAAPVLTRDLSITVSGLVTVIW